MNSRRTVIGGVDVTDALIALVESAPPLAPAQTDRIRALFAQSGHTAIRGSRASRRSAAAATTAPSTHCAEAA
jgi:hypothetical protein